MKEVIERDFCGFAFMSSTLLHLYTHQKLSPSLLSWVHSCLMYILVHLGRLGELMPRERPKRKAFCKWKFVTIRGVVRREVHYLKRVKWILMGGQLSKRVLTDLFNCCPHFTALISPNSKHTNAPPQVKEVPPPLLCPHVWVDELMVRVLWSFCLTEYKCCFRTGSFSLKHTTPLGCINLSRTSLSFYWTRDIQCTFQS